MKLKQYLNEVYMSKSLARDYDKANKREIIKDPDMIPLKDMVSALKKIR